MIEAEDLAEEQEKEERRDHLGLSLLIEIKRNLKKCQSRAFQFSAII